MLILFGDKFETVLAIDYHIEESLIGGGTIVFYLIKRSRPKPEAIVVQHRFHKYCWIGGVVSEGSCVVSRGSFKGTDHNFCGFWSP